LILLNIMKTRSVQKMEKSALSPGTTLSFEIQTVKLSLSRTRSEIRKIIDFTGFIPRHLLTCQEHRSVSDYISATFCSIKSITLVSSFTLFNRFIRGIPPGLTQLISTILSPITSTPTKNSPSFIRSPLIA